jgi:glucokinase
VADDYFSTRWFLNEYEVLSGRVVAGVKELAENASANSEIYGLFGKFGVNLGSFLVPWLLNCNADCLVIGGNISAAYNLFGEKLSAEFNKAGVQVQVLLSTLGEDAALAGSASLCDNEFYSRLIHNRS